MPARATLKVKRDYTIRVLLAGFGLRRRELACLSIDDIQMRENRWVLAGITCNGCQVRTVTGHFGPDRNQPISGGAHLGLRVTSAQ